MSASASARAGGLVACRCFDVPSTAGRVRVRGGSEHGRRVRVRGVRAERGAYGAAGVRARRELYGARVAEDPRPAPDTSRGDDTPAPEEATRVGVVDLGTNSTRLLVAEVHDGRVAELD